MDIGESVKTARERRGWNKSDLARQAELDPSTISRIESGQRPRPSGEVLEKIAAALGLSYQQLVGTTPTPPIPLAGRISRTEDLDLPVYRSHAGRLILADPTPLDRFRIRADRTYMVQVVGDCLAWENIDEGDRLIVDREARPETNRIVVVRIGDETYLTKWKRQHNGMVELEMSDGQLRDALVHDLDVQGVVVNVIKPAP